MSGARFYGGVIWTNHALERLNQRGFSQTMAYEAYRHADSFLKAKDGSIEYKKRFGSSTVSVIAKQNEKREWLILSAWIYPPIEGTEDHKKHLAYQEYKKASGLRKLFLVFKRQLGF